MKLHKLLSVSSLAILLLAGCAREYDDSALQNRIDGLVAQSEEDTNSIRILARAIQKASEAQLTVTVTETEEGWLLEFSDGTSLTLPKGKKGETGDKGVSGDKGETGDPGDKGADLDVSMIQDGSYYIIRIGEDTYTFSMTQSFILNIDQEGLAFNAGETLRIPYTLTGDDGTVHLYIMDEKGFSADVDEKEKVIIVTIPDPLPADAYVVVSAVKNSTGEQSSRYIGQIADGGTLVATPSFTLYAHHVLASFDLSGNFAKAGVLVSADSDPVLGGSGVTEYSTESPSGTLSFSVSNLDAGTVYYVRPFAVNVAGKPLYAASQSVTTLSDPLTQWSVNGGENATQWNALAGFGMDETLITPTETQKTLEGYVNAAAQAYYGLPFSHTRNLIQEVNGQKYMFVYLYVDDQGAIADPVEANQYGGFAYKMSVTPDYKVSFSLEGFVFIHPNKWIVRVLEKPTDYLTEMWNSSLINKADLEKFVYYFTDHTFQFEWMTPDLAVGSAYSDVEMIPVDDPDLAFNYHLRKETDVFGNFDLTIHPLDYKRGGDEPGEDPGYDKALTTVANFNNNGSGAYALVKWADRSLIENAKSWTYEALCYATFTSDGQPGSGSSNRPAGHSGSDLYFLMGCERGMGLRYLQNGGTDSGQTGKYFMQMYIYTGNGERDGWFVENAGYRTEQWNEWPDRQWFHLAVSYDHETGVMSWYRNGELLHTRTKDPLTMSLVFNPAMEGQNYQGFYLNEFYLGCNYETSRWWPGCIMEARVWNRALSATEIGAEGHATSVDPSTATGLIGYWKCNEGEGNTLHDYSGHGNHAEVVSETPILWQNVTEVGK